MVQSESVTVQKDSRQPIDNSARIKSPCMWLSDSSERFKTISRQFGQGKITLLRVQLKPVTVQHGSRQTIYSSNHPA